MYIYIYVTHHTRPEVSLVQVSWPAVNMGISQENPWEQRGRAATVGSGPRRRCGYVDLLGDDGEAALPISMVPSFDHVSSLFLKQCALSPKPVGFPSSPVSEHLCCAQVAGCP